jgi:hypothetical protein
MTGSIRPLQADAFSRWMSRRFRAVLDAAERVPSLISPWREAQPDMAFCQAPQPNVRGPGADDPPIELVTTGLATRLSHCG